MQDCDDGLALFLVLHVVCLLDQEVVVVMFFLFSFGITTERTVGVLTFYVSSSSLFLCFLSLEVIVHQSQVLD
jgi:hypothetical protein